MSDKTEEDNAIETMLDRVQSDYSNLSRDELREIFHATYERLAREEQFRAGLEAAAKIADGVKRRGLDNLKGGDDKDYDQGYSEAAQEIATIIRAVTSSAEPNTQENSDRFGAPNNVTEP